MPIQHTPTPWGMAPQNADEGFRIGIGSLVGGGHTICFFPTGAENPNAEKDIKFILRACNAHEELLALLVLVKKTMGNRGVYNDSWGTKLMTGADEWQQVENAITAAIAKAEAK